MRHRDRTCGRFVAGNCAKQRIGVPDDVFRGRLYGNVHAMLERLEVKRGGPGVIQGDGNVSGPRGPANRRNVLNLEGLRAGRLGKDEFRLRLQESSNTGPDERIVILDVNADAFQYAVCETPGRLVDAVADENVPPALRESQKRS